MDSTIRGGDVFEVVLRPDGSSSVLIADISSKGTPSIGHADMLRRAFRRAANETNNLGRILSTLDALRFEGIPHSFNAIFATAFVAEIDYSSSELRYASAGHEAALVVTGRSHRHLHATGPLLGVLDGASHDECREPFERGSLLVVATDGFSECRNTALDSMQFGTAGIVRALAFDKRRTTRSAAEIIARGADTFTGGRYHDDATVAVISRTARSTVRATPAQLWEAHAAERDRIDLRIDEPRARSAAAAATSFCERRSLDDRDYVAGVGEHDDV